MDLKRRHSSGMGIGMGMGSAAEVVHGLSVSFHPQIWEDPMQILAPNPNFVSEDTVGSDLILRF